MGGEPSSECGSATRFAAKVRAYSDLLDGCSPARSPRCTQSTPTWAGTWPSTRRRARNHQRLVSKHDRERADDEFSDPDRLVGPTAPPCPPARAAGLRLKLEMASALTPASRSPGTFGPPREDESTATAPLLEQPRRPRVRHVSKVPVDDGYLLPFGILVRLARGVDHEHREEASVKDVMADASE
jgi:hypothetical protein